MPSITTKELLAKASAALVGQGFDKANAQSIAAEFVMAELEGVRTHGVGKLVSMNYGQIDAIPKISTTGCIVSADGAGSCGFLLMRKLAEMAKDHAIAKGFCIVFARNFSRYSSLYPYTDSIARGGLVAILANTAGPAAVAPFGSIDPITGTNPICFSFPTTDGVQSFDFATAEVVWGEIRQAALESRGVKQGAFLNASGEVTTLPDEVNAVRAFGGAKGWALNLGIEIICGLLAGAKAGLDVQSEFDCGAVLIAIRPDACGADSNFSQLVSKLLADIRKSRPSPGGEEVRCPGDRNRGNILPDKVGSRPVQVPQTTLDLLSRMAEGKRIAELSQNPKYN